MNTDRPLYLIRRVSRHGAVCWYFWRRPGPQIRLREVYGTRAFWAEYQAALGGKAILAPASCRKRAAAGSLAWLVERYRDSSAWSDLSAGTHRQRDNIFERVLKQWGDEPAGSITRADIVATRDAKRETPSAANNFVGTMRGLYQWAVEAQHVKNDPTAGVKSVGRKGQGHRTWTEDDIAAFEARWPAGSRERLALHLLVYTGLRRGDVAALGRQHVQNGIISIATEKTGTAVHIRILPPLQETIDATKTGNLTFLGHARTGRPMSKEGFGNWFGKAARAAGVEGNCHGLRKAGAVRAAYAGATTKELMALFGWDNADMAELYTRDAERRRLAEGAVEKLSRAVSGRG